MTSPKTVVVDLLFLGRHKTGYFTYSLYVLTSIYEGLLFPNTHAIILLASDSCLLPFIKTLRAQYGSKPQIICLDFPIHHSFFRFFGSTIITNLISIRYNPRLIFSPINYGPLFTFYPHLLLIHDLSVFVLPARLQHRSRLLTSLIKFFVFVSTHTSSYILCQSASTARILIHTFKSLQRKVSVSYLPRPHRIISSVDSSKSNSYVDSSLCRTRSQSVHVLYVSSFYPLKNQILVVRAARLLPSMQFTIIGKPLDSSYYSQCLELQRNIDNVQIETQVEDYILSSFYKRAHIYVQPSYFEGLSYTPFEALYYRCFLVLSDIDAHREFYESACSGFFDPQDEFALVSCLERVAKTALYSMPPYSHQDSKLSTIGIDHTETLNSYL